ncbi:MAG: hypothetical protein WCK82_11170 [Bacteroidota bacterium]
MNPVKKAPPGADVTPPLGMRDKAPPEFRKAPSAKPRSDEQEMVEYRKRPDYSGYEDYTPSGRAALSTYNTAAEKAGDFVKRKDGPPYSPSAAKAAQQSQRDTASEIQRETRGKVGSAASGKYAKGGSVSASRRADGVAQRGKTKGRML